MNQEPDWSLYRTFLAVLETGSLSGAARQLALTQPTVARHIEALETAVGADLFMRTPRGLTPTEIATAMQPDAASIAATAASLLRTASARAGEVRGVVRISASEVMGVEHLPKILASLRQRHPDLAVELLLNNSVNDLLQREADIAVRHVEPTQDALVVRRLPAITLGLHAHRAYLARRRTPATIADLAGHDLIGFDRGTPGILALAQRFTGYERAAFALRTDSDLAQLACIRAGYGIGICQVPVARRDTTMVRVLGDAVSLDLGVHIVMHENLKSSARCRAVFDALAAGLTVPA